MTTENTTTPTNVHTMTNIFMFWSEGQTHEGFAVPIERVELKNSSAQKYTLNCIILGTATQKKPRVTYVPCPSPEQGINIPYQVHPAPSVFHPKNREYMGFVKVGQTLTGKPKLVPADAPTGEQFLVLNLYGGLKGKCEYTFPPEVKIHFQDTGEWGNPHYLVSFSQPCTIHVKKTGRLYGREGEFVIICDPNKTPVCMPLSEYTMWQDAQDLVDEQSEQQPQEQPKQEGIMEINNQPQPTQPTNPLGRTDIEVVNCTPHALNILDADGNIITIQPSGTIARCTSTSIEVGRINNIPVFKIEYGDIQDLPEPQDNKVFVVSRIVLSALERSGTHRPDVIGVGEGVRNEQGQIVGAKGFSL